MDRKSTLRMAVFGRTRSFDTCARVVRSNALHGEAEEGANREGHRSLVESLILRGLRRRHKAKLEKVGEGKGVRDHFTL